MNIIISGGQIIAGLPFHMTLSANAEVQFVLDDQTSSFANLTGTGNTRTLEVNGQDVLRLSLKRRATAEGSVTIRVYKCPQGCHTLIEIIVDPEVTMEGRVTLQNPLARLVEMLQRLDIAVAGSGRLVGVFVIGPCGSRQARGEAKPTDEKPSP